MMSNLCRSNTEANTAISTVANTVQNTEINTVVYREANTVQIQYKYKSDFFYLEPVFPKFQTIPKNYELGQ